MVPTISYFIIFGIISIATGKSVRYGEDSSKKIINENEIQRLLLSMANQASYDGPSNFEEDEPNTYQENGASQYNKKPSKVYYQQYKANPQQYYKSYENADEDKPNYNSLQIINRFLTQNEDNAGYDNAQNLLEDLLSLDRKTKFKPMKYSYVSNNNDEVLAVLGNLQTKLSDVENYRTFGKDSDNNLKPKKLLLGVNNDQPDDVLIQGKDGIMALFGNIVGKKSQNYNPDYYNNLNYKSRLISLDDKDDDSYNVRDDLRCNGKNCARTNRAINSKNRLRCNGKNCARSKTTIRSDSKPKAQKIKLNDELDAVVLQLSDVDHLLSKLYPPKFKQRSNKLRANNNLKSFQNVDLQSFLSSKKNIGKNTNVEAVVFDLTKVENGAAVAKQIKRLLSKDSDDEYEEYGNLVEDNLKQGIYDLQQDIAAGKDNVKIIAQNENTNYVYLPQWLVKEAKSYGPGVLNPVEVPSKLSLPSPRQQKTKRLQLRKAKHFRRNLDQDVGVPFHLEVEGLGQVNP